MLCEHAGLIKRYFYESFSDREALLRAVYDAQIEPLKLRLVEAVTRPGLTIQDQIEVGVELFVRGLTSDVRVANIVFLESLSSGPALRTRAHQVILELSELLLALLATHAPDPDTVRTPRSELGALALIGAARQLISDWAMRDQATDVEEIVRVCTDLFALVYDRWLLEQG